MTRLALLQAVWKPVTNGVCAHTFRDKSEGKLKKQLFANSQRGDSFVSFMLSFRWLWAGPGQILPDPQWNGGNAAGDRPEDVGPSRRSAGHPALGSRSAGQAPGSVLPVPAVLRLPVPNPEGPVGEGSAGGERGPGEKKWTPRGPGKHIPACRSAASTLRAQKWAGERSVAPERSAWALQRAGPHGEDHPAKKSREEKEGWRGDKWTSQVHTQGIFALLFGHNYIYEHKYVPLFSRGGWLNDFIFFLL